jgi:hypothetical protein
MTNEAFGILAAFLTVCFLLMCRRLVLSSRKYRTNILARPGSGKRPDHAEGPDSPHSESVKSAEEANEPTHIQEDSTGSRYLSKRVRRTTRPVLARTGPVQLRNASASRIAARLNAFAVVVRSHRHRRPHCKPQSARTRPQLKMALGIHRRNTSIEQRLAGKQRVQR